MLFVFLFLCVLCKKNEKQTKKKKEKRFSSFSLFEGEKTNHTTKEEERSFAQKFCLLYIVHTQSLFVFSLTEEEEEEEEDKWRSSTTRASIRFIT